MKFAKIVFWIAGAFGVVAVISLYRMPGDTIYYGLLATLMAWQAAFFVIGADPQRFRPLMIPAVMEKALWMATLVVFHFQGRVTASDLAANAATHGLLGVLFVIAFFRAKPARLGG
jgi:hypothetical protein